MKRRDFIKQMFLSAAFVVVAGSGLANVIPKPSKETETIGPCSIGPQTIGCLYYENEIIAVLDNVQMSFNYSSPYGPGGDTIINADVNITNERQAIELMGSKGIGTSRKRNLLQLVTMNDNSPSLSMDVYITDIVIGRDTNETMWSKTTLAPMSEIKYY